MGKFDEKKNKRSERRTRPVENLPTVQEAERITSLEQSPVEEQYPVLVQLSHAAEEEREYACRSFANLVLDSESNLKALVEHGGLKKVMQNLCDTSVSVRVAAAGALRNTTIAGGDEICELLVRQDIMTPLLSIIQQYNQMIGNQSVDQMKPYHSLAIQVVALFTNLSESSTRAVELFSNFAAVGMALQFLKQDVYPIELCIETAQLLNVVTENNAVSSQQLLNSVEHMNFLQSLVSNTSTNIYLRVLVAAILYNVTFGHSSHINMVSSFFPLLCEVSQFDGTANIAQVLTNYIQALQENPDNKRIDEIDTTLTKEYESWRKLMKSQQTAFELLSNICAGDEDTDQPMNANTSMEEYVEVTTNGLEGVQSVVNETIKQMATSASLLQKTLPKCNFPPKEFSSLFLQYHQVLIAKQQKMQDTNNHPLSNLLSNEEITDIDIFNGVFELIKNNQWRAVGCVSNLLLMYTVPELGDINQLWTFFCQLCIAWSEEHSQLPPSLRKEVLGFLLDSFTSNLLILVRKWKASPTVPFTPETNHIMGILELARSSPFEETRSNAVGIVGVLGQHQQFSSIIGDLARVLIDRSLNDSSVMVIAEALNSIFDVFAETNYNTVVVQSDMMNNLVRVQQNLKQLLKTNKKNIEEELYDRLEEAEVNLGRFIAYKAEQFK